MNKDILRQAGFEEEVQRIEQGNCPICEIKIVLTSFRDPLSIKEFKISGMCQDCQDKVFTLIASAPFLLAERDRLKESNQELVAELKKIVAYIGPYRSDPDLLELVNETHTVIAKSEVCS